MPFVLIELQYLPPIEYFSAISHHEKIWIEQWEYFQKQTYRSRCQILGNHGVNTLTVPVQEGRSKVLIRDLRIDYRQNWVRQHGHTLQTAYGRSPFWEFYKDYLHKVYEQKPNFLFDLNWGFFEYLCKWLQIDSSKIKFTDSYQTAVNEGVTDARSVINPKQSYACRAFYEPKPYRQNFQEDFIPNLSIIDLLCAEGPQAKRFL